MEAGGRQIFSSSSISVRNRKGSERPFIGREKREEGLIFGGKRVEWKRGKPVEKKIRTGVIGLGKMGILHSALIKMIPQAELVSVHDTNKKLSKYVSNSGLNVTFFPNLAQMLDQSNLDAVFVCTPPSIHLPVASECVERGLNVFVEKPLSESLSSAEKMVSLVENSGIIHATGYTLGHIPIYRKAKEILEKKTLGEIHRFCVSVYISQVLTRKKGWFYDKSKSGGGVLIDIASHLIYLLTWYFGLPRKVYGRTHNFFSEVEDCATVFLEYGNGLCGVLDAHWSLPGYRMATIEITLEGKMGNMEITNDYIKLNLREELGSFGEGWTTIHKIDMGSPSPFDLGGEGFYEEDRNFIECCLNRENPFVSWKDGLDVQRIIEAVYASAGSLQPTEVSRTG